MTADGCNNLLVRDLATGKEILLTPHDGPGNFSGLLSPDGGTVWVSSDVNRDVTAFGRTQIRADGTAGPFEVIAERPSGGLNAFDVDE